MSSGLSDLGILCFEVNRLLINKWSALLGLFPIGFVAQLQPLTDLCSAWLPGLAMHLLLIERFRKLGYKNIFRTGVASRNPRGCLMMSEVVICTFPVPCETQSCEQNYYYAVKIGF